jgi:four helix bundle protein
MQRASVSIPSNIAEGQVRKHATEFVHFLSIARGSAAELETQAIIAGRLGYLPQESVGDLISRIEDMGKMIWSLQNSVGK